LLAMAHLQEGKSLKVVAEMLKVNWKTVHSWVSRLRQHGLPGLFESPRSGAPRKLTLEEEVWLKEKIHLLSTQPTGGRITGQELHEIMRNELGTQCSLRTIYNTLHRLDFSWITARSKHPKADVDRQAAYKKTLDSTL